MNIRNIYFELQMKDQTEERSSQLVHNFLSSCEKKAWKFRLQNGTQTHDLYDAGAMLLPTELSSQLGAGHIVSS